MNLLAEDHPKQTKAVTNVPFSKTVVSGLLLITDFLLVFGSGMTIVLLYIDSDDRSIYLTTIFIADMLAVTFFYAAHLYEMGGRFSPLQQLSIIFPLFSAVFVILIILAFALKISTAFSRVWIFSWYISSLSLLLLSRVALHSLVRTSALSGHLTRNVIIVGSGARVELLVKSLNQWKYPWNNIVGIFDDRYKRFGLTNSLPIRGNIDDLIAYAQHHRCDDIFIALPWYAESRIIDITNKLKPLPARIQLSPEMINFHYNNAMHEYCGIPVLTLTEKPLANWNFLAKSVEDFMIAIILTPFLLPIMAVIALFIKLESHGPVFFRQERYGLNNHTIRIYKFRTMYVECQDDHAEKLTSRNDPRVTRVGSFLRRTSLDEIPQIINVLKGEMSIIGPRPHAAKASAAGKLYQDAVTGYRIRHKVKPGITGWAQVNGWRGETDTVEKILSRVEHDIFYIEHWSVFFDLWILLKTFSVVFTGKNAY